MDQDQMAITSTAVEQPYFLVTITDNVTLFFHSIIETYIGPSKLFCLAPHTKARPFVTLIFAFLDRVIFGVNVFIANKPVWSAVAF